jgi:hypothetical protein
VAGDAVTTTVSVVVDEIDLSTSQVAALKPCITIGSAGLNRPAVVLRFASHERMSTWLTMLLEECEETLSSLPSPPCEPLPAPQTAVGP